ncbi:T-lymphocyte activation antigen CD80 [Alexandromys fortis]|uniref:T-lymphocyte activation antigen CD80 n=1 Tax=Alexandromys fortis TaxID=100897 RepID=UPI0021522F63|nr:T-lymphocyte activation antigen CD80 [Microtus fortis]XP_050004674.1 T-lymphocyte activation antigen CD80 [Microtus fortis]XP_050004675.1 T-lymphocyte activation antigen CD80 [Microtus fortis]
MGCRLRQDTPPPRCPLLWLIHLLVLLVGLSRMSSGVPRVSKSVKEKVSLPCGYNYSVEELARLRIYWQKEKEVVLSYVSGDKEVWPQYKNRTLFDITDNFRLMILRLFLSDRGVYTCVVQRQEQGTYKRKHLNSVELLVRADYAIPNITHFGNPSADIRRMMCFSSGGFPKPDLSWLVNGKEIRGINTTISQDPESELYTVSSQLDFNVTYNHSIVCRIAYGDSQVSKNYTWEKPPEAPPDRNHTTTILITGLGVFLAMPIAICVMYRCFRRRNEASERENNIIYLGPVEVSTENNV